MTNQELKNKVNAIFKSQPKIDELIVCEDGNCFYSKDVNKAQAHCAFSVNGKREKPLKKVLVKRGSTEISFNDELNGAAKKESATIVKGDDSEKNKKDK